MSLQIQEQDVESELLVVKQPEMKEVHQETCWTRVKNQLRKYTLISIVKFETGGIYVNGQSSYTTVTGVLFSIIFIIVLLGYIIGQIHTLGLISTNSKGVSKLDAFLNENQGNLLDSMNQTGFSDQLSNDI